MIVVAIVGVLALLAVHGVRNYLMSSKTAEARNSLGQIAKDEAAAYERESMAASILPTGSSAALARQLCASATLSIPAASSSIQGKKYQSSPTEWSHDALAGAGFACLKYIIDDPQYYMYSFSSGGAGSVGASFVATANGDLDGDGVLSTFSVVGSITPEYSLAIAPNIGELFGTE
jgi:type IV pilus assembly protein PilA